MHTLKTLERDRTQNRVPLLPIALLPADVDAAVDKVR